MTLGVAGVDGDRVFARLCFAIRGVPGRTEMCALQAVSTASIRQAGSGQVSEHIAQFAC